MRALSINPGAWHRFNAPTVVTVEASDDFCYDNALDTFEGEQFDHIHDVIMVESTGEFVTLTTCRTVERPGRPIFTIPRHAIKAAFIPE